MDFPRGFLKIVDVNGKPEVVQYCTTSEGASMRNTHRPPDLPAAALGRRHS